MKHLFLAATLGLWALAGTARGDIVTQWDFNAGNDANTSTGTLTPVIGSGTAQLVGGTTGTFASGDASGGSTDPNVGDDSAWNLTGWAPQGTGNKQRGAQFNVSTLGITQGIVVSFDQRLSNTAANTWRFQYSLDGINFIDGDQFTFTPAATGTGDVWYNNRTVDLTGISGVSNNADFAFRIVAEFDPIAGAYVAARSTSSYGTTGTSRFDMVTVTAIPEPTAGAIIGLVGLMGLAVRRRRVS